MANNENLKPYKKGQSGNPNGRPKKIPEIDLLLADVLGEEQNDLTGAKAILIALRNKAIKGDVRAAEVLLDRAYGKQKATLDITTLGHGINTSQVIVQAAVEQVLPLAKNEGEINPEKDDRYSNTATVKGNGRRKK